MPGAELSTSWFRAALRYIAAHGPTFAIRKSKMKGSLQGLLFFVVRVVPEGRWGGGKVMQVTCHLVFFSVNTYNIKVLLAY